MGTYALAVVASASVGDGGKPAELEKRSAGEYLTRLEILARLKAHYGAKAS